MKNEVEVRCGLEVSVFQKKGPKREPRGHPTELLLVPFGSLLAYFFDLCVPWGFRNRLRAYWLDLVWFWVPFWCHVGVGRSGAEWSGVERSGAEWSGVERSRAE